MSNSSKSNPEPKRKSKNRGPGSRTKVIMLSELPYAKAPIEVFLPLIKLLAREAAEDEFLDQYGYLPNKIPQEIERRKEELAYRKKHKKKWMTEFNQRRKKEGDGS